MDVQEKDESDQIRILVYKLASQKIDECPFSAEFIKTARGATWAMVKTEKAWIQPEKSDRDQELRIRPLQSFMKFCKDPDRVRLNDYAKGVRLGWHGKTDRAPTVFERKTKWALGSEKARSESL